MKFRSRRQPTDSDARLIVDGEEIRVRLVNVSAGGAQVAGLRDGTELGEAALMVGRHHLRGYLAWVEDDRAGLSFKRECTPAELAQLSGRIGGAAMKTARRTRFILG